MPNVCPRRSPIRQRLFVSAVLLGVAVSTLPPDMRPAHAEAEAQVSKPALFPALARYVRSLPKRFATIEMERKMQLERLAAFIRAQRGAHKTAELVFICTHNSRRSHMAQLWAIVAAAQYRVPGVQSFSGGIETTAFHPNAVAALERAGFRIDKPPGENPHYKVRYAKNRPFVEAFSKKYDDPPNPREGFAAIMTCSHADASCPFILGASLRVPLPFEDPRAADGTPAQVTTYDARAEQVATEMFYLFSKAR